MAWGEEEESSERRARNERSMDDILMGLGRLQALKSKRWVQEKGGVFEAVAES